MRKIQMERERERLERVSKRETERVSDAPRAVQHHTQVPTGFGVRV